MLRFSCSTPQRRVDCGSHGSPAVARGALLKTKTGRRRATRTPVDGCTSSPASSWSPTYPGGCAESTSSVFDRRTFLEELHSSGRGGSCARTHLLAENLSCLDADSGVPQSFPSGSGHDVVDVLDPGRPVEERPDEASPTGVVLRLAEPDRVRFQALPLDQQHEPARRFDATSQAGGAVARRVG